MRWDLPRSIRIPNLTFLASLIPDLRKGIQNLKNGPWTLSTPFWGYFMREMRLVKIYLYTKFEVSSFTRSKDMAHARATQWLDARGCAQTNAWISVVFYLTLPNLASI